MNARTLLNVLLALFLAGLVALVIFEPGKETPPVTNKLTTLDPENINKIVIEQPEHSKILLQKNKYGWEMLEPLQISANDVLVDNLLDILKSRSHSRYSAPKVDLGQFNLTSPNLKIYFNDTALAFGTTDPLRGYRYILINNEVHLITDRYSHLIRGKITSLVSPQLLPGNAILNKLELPDLTLQSNENGWTASPDTNFESADDIQKLLDEWHYARAIEVNLDEKTAGQPGNENNSAILIHTTNNGTYRFRVSSRKDEIILTRTDMKLSYHFDKQLGERLLGHRINKSSPIDTTSVKPE